MQHFFCFKKLNSINICALYACRNKLNIIKKSTIKSAGRFYQMFTMFPHGARIYENFSFFSAPIQYVIVF